MCCINKHNNMVQKFKKLNLDQIESEKNKQTMKSLQGLRNVY